MCVRYMHVRLQACFLRVNERTDVCRVCTHLFEAVGLSLSLSLSPSLSVCTYVGRCGGFISVRMPPYACMHVHTVDGCMDEWMYVGIYVCLYACVFVLFGLHLQQQPAVCNWGRHRSQPS